GDLALARARGVRGIVLCGAFMTLSALVLLLFRDGIVGLYTDDPSVVAVALTLLLVAGVFQISDGLQVGASGALRGMQDTQVPMWLTTIAYWCIGFPLAYVAAFVLDAPPAIIWCGLVVGLSCAAVALILRFRWVSQSMHRIRAARPDKVS
ncbi:MAG: MATE family efflux transporter, partial [Pseudomonadota bacterium]